MEKPLLLRTLAVGKSFSGNRALDGITLEFRAGDVLALMGENGAGKSTLMKILAGVWPAGTFDGKIEMPPREGGPAVPVEFHSTFDAMRAGIAMIFQELSLFPELTVAEHLELERLPGVIDWEALFTRTQDFLDQTGLSLRADAKVGTLPIGERQMVEIARALYRDARVLVFDEPTSALTEQETLVLYRIIRSLREAGKSVVYITHRMSEVFEVADRIAVLRDGKFVQETPAFRDGSRIPRGELEPKLISWMVGRSIEDIYPSRNSSFGTEALRVEDLTLRAPSGKTIVEHISFSVKKGEILGLGGLLGSGRSETLEAIFGVAHGSGPRGSGYETLGKVFIEGKEAKPSKPSDAIRSKIAFVSEDRKKSGLLLGQAIQWNASLPSVAANLAGLSGSHALSLVSLDKEREAALHWTQALRIRSMGVDQPVRELSGGNQQKVVLAKWLLTDPSILLLDEPTRGVDVGAKVEIYHWIRDLSAKGMAIVLASSEMPELLGLCHRIVVLREGRVSEEIGHADATQERIMRAAALA